MSTLMMRSWKGARSSEIKKGASRNLNAKLDVNSDNEYLMARMLRKSNGVVKSLIEVKN
jgi:hypothetical protein